MVWGQSFKDPIGVTRNLYLYSNGGMTIEYPFQAPGVEAALLDNNGNPVILPPGSCMKASTAFGRFYLAPSDGLHGTDVPLQYDGTFLDRVTQDGPGAPPNIVSLPLPSVAMVATGSGLSLTVSLIATSGFINITVPDGQGGTITYSFYSTITVTVTSGASGLQVGTSATIAGNTNAVFNTAFTISQIVSDTEFICSAYNAGAEAGAGGTADSAGGVTLVRVGNVVTAKTAAAHQLQPGYQAQIAGVTPSQIGGGIASIVINNEQNPGLATVTTNNPHGLIPNLNVSIAGVAAASVGTVSTIRRSGQIVTVVMAAGSSIAPGALITVAGVTTASFDIVAAQVLSVTQTASPGDTFTYAQADVDASDTTGTVTLNWPIPNTPTPTFFQVQSAPTPTTFQIAIDYSDGSWTGGTVSFAWDGTFYVLTAPTATTFTYQQYGPPASTTVVGSVTPFGQAAPGNKQMQVLFLTRQGYTTAPSPPVQFVASGGQYYSVTNIPIGPPNVIARILAFTGAEGAFFFYIPAPPQVNGLLVGTATQINDNTTTQVLLDFGDPTLLDAVGISTQGNNLANQIVLDGALGFGFYGSRLVTYGQRNVVDNLVNMGFDGGYLPSSPGTYGAAQPTGWTPSNGVPGLLATGRFGEGYQINVSPGASPPDLFQSFYEDSTGAPIATANTQYRLRVYLNPSVIAADVNFIMTIQSMSLTFFSTATINGSQMSLGGSWIETAFSIKTPVSIPADMVINLYGISSVTTMTLLVDDISLIYSASPYSVGMLMSYPNAPEGFDGVSGVITPVSDTHPVLDIGIVRDNLQMLTQDPGGRLHETSQGITEPADWVVEEVASSCGVVSAFTFTRSQADDATAVAGKDWGAWFSSTGIQIYGGSRPDKISQEIQRPKGQTFPGAPPDLTALNTAALLTVWGLNDPDQQIMYFGIPTGTATAPNVIWQLCYTGLDTADAIVGNPPIHKSLSGKLVATDLGRKWSPFQLTMNGAAQMYRASGQLATCFFAGNGSAPNTLAGGFANAYALDPSYYTDDDYGLVAPYYVTYGFPDRDAEQQLQLGGGLKMLTYQQAFFFGVGNMGWSVYCNTLGPAFIQNGLGSVQVNPWPLTGTYPMQLSPPRNAEWPGGQAVGQRFFHKFASSPNPQGTTASPATDNAFSLTVLVCGMKPNARGKVAGTYP